MVEEPQQPIVCVVSMAEEPQQPILCVVSLTEEPHPQPDLCGVADTEDRGPELQRRGDLVREESRPLRLDAELNFLSARSCPGGSDSGGV